MDHFDRIFEAGRGSESGANGSSEEDSGGLLRGAKPEDPFRLKKAGPPDFEFVSNKWFTLWRYEKGGNHCQCLQSKVKWRWGYMREWGVQFALLNAILQENPRVSAYTSACLRRLVDFYSNDPRIPSVQKWCPVSRGSYNFWGTCRC